MIDINFASRNYRLVARVYSGLLAGCVLLAIVTAAQFWQFHRIQTETNIVQRGMQQAEITDDQIQPLLREREKFIKDLASMSGLVETRRFSWTRLLTDIEKAFPVGVALNRLGYNPRDHGLSLDGTAQSPESLRNLIIGLEKSTSIKDPYLKHQTLDQGSISFNVVAVYHEEDRPAVAQRK